MPRCSACEVAWPTKADPCWNCGQPGDGEGTYSSAGQTQEPLPTQLLEMNKRWMETADVDSLLADA